MCEPFGMSGDDGAELLMMAVVAVVVGAIVARIVWRIVRHQGLRAQASGNGRWVGRSREFGQLVAAAVPDLAERAQRSARRQAMRNGSRGSRGSNGVRQVTGFALSQSGVGARTRSSARGSCVAVMGSQHGEITVGDVRVTARTSGRDLMSRGRGGRANASSSSTHAAAAARLPGQVPTIRLARAGLLSRVMGSDEEHLPEELTKRFEVQELGAGAEEVLLASGAWRSLLDDAAKIEAVTVDRGHVVVASRRRCTPARARALVRVVEELVAALPDASWGQGGARGRLRPAGVAEQ